MCHVCLHTYCAAAVGGSTIDYLQSLSSLSSTEKAERAISLVSKLLVITLLNFLFKRVQVLEFFVSAHVYAIATFIADFHVQSGYEALWNASPDGISLTVRAWPLPTHVNLDPIR